MRISLFNFGSDSFYKEHRRIYQIGGAAEEPVEPPEGFTDLLNSESFGEKKEKVETADDIGNRDKMKEFVQKQLEAMNGWDRIKDPDQKTKIIENIVNNLLNADNTPVADASKLLESMKTAIQEKLANEGFLRRETNRVEQNDGTIVDETTFKDDLWSKDANTKFQKTGMVGDTMRTVGKMDISYTQPEIEIRLNTGQVMTLSELVAYVQSDECRVVDLLAVKEQLQKTRKDIRYWQKNATGTYRNGPNQSSYSYGSLMGIKRRAKNSLTHQNVQAAINEIEQDSNIKEGQIKSLTAALQALNSNQRDRLSTHERDGTQKSENRLQRVREERSGVWRRGVDRFQQRLFAPELARILQEEREEKEQKAKEEAALRGLKEWDQHRGNTALGNDWARRQGWRKEWAEGIHPGSGRGGLRPGEGEILARGAAAFGSETYSDNTLEQKEEALARGEGGYDPDAPEMTKEQREAHTRAQKAREADRYLGRKTTEEGKDAEENRVPDSYEGYPAFVPYESMKEMREYLKDNDKIAARYIDDLLKFVRNNKKSVETDPHFPRLFRAFKNSMEQWKENPGRKYGDLAYMRSQIEYMQRRDSVKNKIDASEETEGKHSMIVSSPGGDYFAGLEKNQSVKITIPGNLRAYGNGRDKEVWIKPFTVIGVETDSEIQAMMDAGIFIERKEVYGNYSDGRPRIGAIEIHFLKAGRFLVQDKVVEVLEEGGARVDEGDRMEVEAEEEREDKHREEKIGEEKIAEFKEQVKPLGSFARENISEAAYLAHAKEVLKTPDKFYRYEELFLDPFSRNFDNTIPASLKQNLRNIGREVTGVEQKERDIEAKYRVTIETEANPPDNDIRSAPFSIRSLDLHLPELEHRLSRYPIEFLRNSRLTTIYLRNAPELKIRDNRSRRDVWKSVGGVQTGLGIVVSDIDWSLDHEIFHAADAADRQENDNSDWIQRAHGGMDVYTNANGAQAVLAREGSGFRPPNFARDYGRAGGVDEDQATVADMMLRNSGDYNLLNEWAKHEPPLKVKVDMTKEFYLRMSDGLMDETFWNDLSQGRKIDQNYWEQRRKK